MKKLMAACILFLGLNLSLSLSVFAEDTSVGEVVTETTNEVVTEPTTNGVANEDLVIALSQQNWKTYDTEYKKDLLYVLMFKCAENLDIDVPSLDFFTVDERPDMYYAAGYYTPKSYTVHINEAILNSAKNSITCIAHETRHAWQWVIAKNPFNEITYAMKENNANYISYTPEDPQPYRSQIVEVDARNYADYVSADFEIFRANLQ